MGFILKIKLKFVLVTTSVPGVGRWILLGRGKHIFLPQVRPVHFVAPQRNENIET